jgi:hypothetical protein
MRISGNKFEAARLAANCARSELEKLTFLSRQRIWQLSTEEESIVGDLAGYVIAKRLNVQPEQLAP